MSANTKIVVLRRKELLYTGIFAALGVLFIILLLMLLLPGKDTDASYGTPDSPDDTAAAEMPDNVADVSTGAVADTGNTYIPGIYTTELILGNETVNVEVIVSDHAITSVSLADPSETLTTMYPLLESTMESLNDQLCEMQDPEQVTYSAETRYTSLVLLEAVKASPNAPYPFTEPIITPFTKCFCTKGYKIISGILPNTIIAYFNTSMFAARILCSAVVAISSKAATEFMILRRTTCSVNLFSEDK